MPRDHVTYQILNRRSGEELARYAMPTPDRMAAGNDDLIAEWFPAGPVGCQGESSLVLYEGFQPGVPAGEGYVVEDWPYMPGTVAWSKMLCLGETMVIEAGQYHRECIYPIPGWVWYVVHPRDGSGGVFHSLDRGVRGAGRVWGLAESRGHGFLLLGNSAAVLDRGEVVHDCCPSRSTGPCLLEIGPDASIVRTECIVDGMYPGPANMWMVAGRKTVLVGWTEGEIEESPRRVRALRFDDGEPTEIVADFHPDWSPLGFAWTSGQWHWTPAGDGFVLLGELSGDDTGKRGLILVDQAGSTIRQVVIDALPPYVGTGLAGGLGYQVGTTDECVDVGWVQIDQMDEIEGEPGYRTQLWLQSFCCVP